MRSFASFDWLFRKFACLQPASWNWSTFPMLMYSSSAFHMQGDKWTKVLLWPTSWLKPWNLKGEMGLSMAGVCVMLTAWQPFWQSCMKSEKLHDNLNACAICIHAKAAHAYWYCLMGLAKKKSGGTITRPPYARARWLPWQIAVCKFQLVGTKKSCNHTEHYQGWVSNYWSRKHVDQDNFVYFILHLPCLTAHNWQNWKTSIPDMSLPWNL